MPITQEDVRLRGHAIECRIYAEDPENNFFPSPGLITRLVQPGGPGIREDCAVFAGWTVPLDYDPMLAKLIAWAPARHAATRLLASALDRARIHGPATNRDLLVSVLRHPAFLAGRADTSLLDSCDLAGLVPSVPPLTEAVPAVKAASVTVAVPVMVVVWPPSSSTLMLML